MNLLNREITGHICLIRMLIWECQLKKCITQKLYSKWKTSKISISFNSFDTFIWMTLNNLSNRKDLEELTTCTTLTISYPVLSSLSWTIDSPTTVESNENFTYCISNGVYTKLHPTRSEPNRV